MALHLAPSSPEIRLAEAQTFQLLKKRPAIAAGDVNAVPAAGPLPQLPKGADEETKEHWRRKCDRRAALAIDAVGFVDAGAVCGDDAPSVGYTHADGVAYRCDRILARLPGGRDAVVSHNVVTGWELSDHRPVVAVLDLAVGSGLMDLDPAWTVALVAGAGYVISLLVHPYTACRACKNTPGRHHGAVITYAHRKCTKCGGTGRQLRLGVRLFLGGADKG